jgi:hypothetical protein
LTWIRLIPRPPFVGVVTIDGLVIWTNPC